MKDANLITGAQSIEADFSQHESAHKHVSGYATYVDDIFEPQEMLHAYPVLSTIACGKVVEIDFDGVLGCPGVVGVVTPDEIPGVNDYHPSGKGSDPVLAGDVISHHGQPLFLVIAKSRRAARLAAKKTKVTYEECSPVLDVLTARSKGIPDVVGPGMKLQRGEPDRSLSASAHLISGSMSIGGQEHFYLEGQVAMAVPGEDGEMFIHSATQHPGHVQEIVARMLGLPSNAVRAQVRRMGGGFGGKETQATNFAAMAALAAWKFKVPVKVRPDRDDDMVVTGKRHDFVVDYTVAFSEEGAIDAVIADFDARCGFSEDLSRGVTDRTLMHADNAYFYPAVRVSSRLLRTNTVSNTAFRGYGGPQGIVAAERWIEEVAYHLGLDPLDVRYRNIYGKIDRNVTPYHQPLTDNIMLEVMQELERTSDYRTRREEIKNFNAVSKFIKRGIALVPVKFGISFSKIQMNQAGALLQIYRDGSVHLNHGGTEMGQGLHTKVLEIVAGELNIGRSKVRITASATDKVPNASPTAGSLGTDLNGMAALDAAQKILLRLAECLGRHWGCRPEEVRFGFEKAAFQEKEISWSALVEMAYQDRVQLSETGFYKTPKVNWNRAEGRGEPYLYFTYGASCSEVRVDTLTGEYSIDRVDILQDVGRSINRGVDIGQVEGGFVQGVGWLTTEELRWNDDGILLTHAPSTYKIPVASDVPKDLRVSLVEWSENAEPTIWKSKAVGEPPVMLAVSVLEAMGMAVSSIADYSVAPRLDPPATPEKVLMAIRRIREA